MTITILSVAEKPSVAKELARIISGEGPMNRRNGYSPYNHIFEIPQCSFKNSAASMKVTSVTGHMMELDFDKAYKSWSSCQPIELFTAPVTKSVKKENENIQKTLVEEARRCNTLLLWLDCDLEGENICFEVINVCKAANPRLDVYRARFSALIPRDIHRTLRFPDRPNEHFNDAVEARQEIDLRLGAAFTRFQTLRLQNKYDCADNSVISYGPCQFPTLGFVVERHMKIQSFRPEDFWSLSCECEGEDPDASTGKLSCTFSWDRGALYDQLSCAVLFQLCVEGGLDLNPEVGGSRNGTSVGGQAKVVKCEARPTLRHRPAPLNTIELQKRASRFLRLGSDRTMQVAEALYQRGLLSYPRTETDFFKEGFELLPLLEEHRGHSEWGAFVSNLVDDQPNRFSWPKNGGHDDQAHPPIHPTKCVESSTFTCADEKRVYDLVCRHFFACCARDGVGQMTEISIRIPAEGWHFESFSTNGLMVLERNWLDVYGKYEKWSAKKVPKFEVGQIFTPTSLVMTSGRTAPPPEISESDLIADMDRNGIGTDATIATHISTIQQRNYVIKDEQNRFHPTKLGLALVEGYNNMGYQLNKPFLRAAMEADCQKIAKGQLRREEVVQSCLGKMKECFLSCTREANKLDEAMSRHFGVLGGASTSREGSASSANGGSSNNIRLLESLFSACGRCKGMMDLRSKSDNGSRHVYCEGCNQLHLLPINGELVALDATCPICQFQVIQVRNLETQKTHNVCPYCFRNPPGPPISEDSAVEFRCFSCAHSTCPLAGRVAGTDVDIAPCLDPQCINALRIKKSPKSGGFMLACSSANCSKVWWLPKYIKSVIPASNGESCQSCSDIQGRLVRKLRFTFTLALAPPGVPPEADACPCCDRLWSQLHFEPLRLPTPPANIQNRGMSTASVVSSVSDSFGGSDYSAALSGSGLAARSSSSGRGRGGRTVPGRGESTGGRSVTLSRNNSKAIPTPQADGDALCGCGEVAVVNTVRKEGPNQGRLFRSCPRGRNGGQGCNFFEWVDGAPANTSAQFAGSGQSSRSGKSNFGSTNVGTDVVCSRCRQQGHYARSCPNK